MKFFLDTANVEAIKTINELGLVDGVTTNPTIISREGRDFETVIKEICDIIDGPVSAEVTGLTANEMVDEARALSKWHDNVIVKIPMTAEGLKATSILSKEGIKINVTLIFTVSQGLMAMKAGASYISPFIGRLEDIGTDPYQLIEALRDIIDIYVLAQKLFLLASAVQLMLKQLLNWDHISQQFRKPFLTRWYNTP